MPKRRLRDIVVLLPGITGSVLQKDGRDVWAASGAAAWGAARTLGGALRGLTLGDDDAEIDDLGDGITAPRLISAPHLVPGLQKIDGYTAVARMITDGFVIESKPGHPSNFIEFPYDWRRDNRVSARALQRTVRDHLGRWREYSGAADARVILVAHSMGGLVARYYLEVLEGWQDCRALITFGTPYRGSLNAIDFLANGYKKLFLDLTEMMQSFTSVYQLLPIYAALGTAEGFRRVAETPGLPGIDHTRAAAALAFHREIESAVTRHQADDAYRDHGYRVLPVIGTRQDTRQSAVLRDGRVAISSELPDGVDEALGDGDGTVPRLSAIPIELSDEYRDTFVAERHATLHCNPAVLVDLRGRLEQMQVSGLGAIRGPEIDEDAPQRPAISIQLDDLYVPDEPVTIHARLVNLDPHSEPLEVRIAAADPAVAPASVCAMRPDGDGWVAEIPGLPPAVYRVTVGPVAQRLSPAPVHDLVEVAG